MNERINLRFHDFSPEDAAFMVACARDFATARIEGKPGPRYGIAYRSGSGAVYLVYWTKGRAVTVIQQAPSETIADRRGLR